MSCNCGCGSVEDCGAESITLPYIVGDAGTNGQSAYQLWLLAGNTGTLADFLASLEGADGQSAYEVAVANGFVGNEAAWLASLVGASAYEVAVANGFVGNEAAWLASLAGTNGINAFSTLAAPFTMPVIGGTITITLVDNSWVVNGQPLQIEGGTWLIATSNPLAGGQVNTRNPGPADGYPTGIANNAPALTVFPIGTRVSPRGTDGVTGPAGTGTPGTPGEVLVVDAFPPAPPAGTYTATRIYYNPGTGISTLLRYNYGTLVWDSIATLNGAAGTQWIDGVGDPNVTLPVAAIGTYYLERTTSEIFQKTGVSTWALRITLNAPAVDLGNNADTHLLAGVFTIDLAFPYTYVDVQADIELDYGAVPGNREWILELENTTGAPIDITFTAAKWAQDATLLSLVPPLVLAAAEVVQMKFRYMQGKMVVVEYFKQGAL